MSRECSLAAMKREAHLQKQIDSLQNQIIILQARIYTMEADHVRLGGSTGKSKLG